VTITTTKTAWAEYLANRPDARAAMAERLQIEGTPEDIAMFMETISAFPFGGTAPGPTSTAVEHAKERRLRRRGRYA
jgi:hypothetical protein